MDRDTPSAPLSRSSTIVHTFHNGKAGAAATAIHSSSIHRVGSREQREGNHSVPCPNPETRPVQARDLLRDLHIRADWQRDRERQHVTRSLTFVAPRWRGDGRTCGLMPRPRMELAQLTLNGSTDTVGRFAHRQVPPTELRSAQRPRVYATAVLRVGHLCAQISFVDASVFESDPGGFVARP